MNATQSIASKWIYDFAEGSREMREMLGGKGANIAEMTRILGSDRVPAGFTISTETCVEYMRAARTPPLGLHEQVDQALARLQAARRPGGPVAPLGALRRARVDARDAGHGAEPRVERFVGPRPG
jgi:pyruvate,orthophosphate dikinase